MCYTGTVFMDPQCEIIGNTFCLSSGHCWPKNSCKIIIFPKLKRPKNSGPPKPQLANTLALNAPTKVWTMLRRLCQESKQWHMKPPEKLINKEITAGDITPGFSLVLLCVTFCKKEKPISESSKPEYYI